MSEISDVLFGMAAPDIFVVLANPVRRRILELLLERPATVNRLVDEFRLHGPAVSEHLQVLRTARLVATNGRAANGIIDRAVATRRSVRVAQAV